MSSDECSRLAVGFAAVLDGSDIEGVAVIMEANPVIADAQAELGRLDILEALHVALAGGGEVGQGAEKAQGGRPVDGAELGPDSGRVAPVCCDRKVLGCPTFAPAYVGLLRIDLTPYAGYSLGLVRLLNTSGAPPGQFDLYFDDISVTRTDGTVGGWPIQAIFWFEWGQICGLSLVYALRTEKIPGVWADSLCNLLLLPSPKVDHRRVGKAYI